MTDGRHAGHVPSPVACALALLVALTCAGCLGRAGSPLGPTGGAATVEGYVSPRQRACLDVTDALLDAWEEGDADGVVALFSPNARLVSEDLGAAAAELVEACPGPVSYVERDSVARPVEREAVEDGMRRTELEFDFMVVCGGRNLWVLASLTTEDDSDEGEVGLASVAVFSEDFYSAMLYDEPGTEYSLDPSLGLYLDYPLEWETRVVGGDPLRYEATGSAPDEAGAAAFLAEGKRSVRDFEDRFGEPCCVSWMGEGHVYYELEGEGDETRYLELNASGADEPIYSAYVVGERGALDRVWGADDGA